MLIFVILAYILFAAIDTAIVLVQHQAARHILKQCADYVRYEGRLSQADENTIRSRLGEVGIPVEYLNTQKESEGEPRVLRSLNAAASCIDIQIVCKPERKPFVIGKLIGGAQVDNNWRIKVNTRVFSERVEP